jgi:hypothetical protein
MHTTKPVREPEHPVTLISDTGQSWKHASLRAFINALGLAWIRANVGANFRESRLAAGELLTHTHPYILRSDFGDILTAEECHETLVSAKPLAWLYRWRPALLTWNGSGAVPYVHRRRHGRYHRRIGTTGEHRAAANVLSEEGEPKFRAARNRHNLPSAWDDCPISGRRDRSWKRFRTTRWKAPRP